MSLNVKFIREATKLYGRVTKKIIIVGNKNVLILPKGKLEAQRTCGKKRFSGLMIGAYHYKNIIHTQKHGPGGIMLGQAGTEKLVRVKGKMERAWHQACLKENFFQSAINLRLWQN